MNEHNLLPDQQRFYNLIAEYPRIAAFWDWQNKSVDIDALELAIATMSHGEQILAKFFLSVWLGKNSGFDVIEAASALDVKKRAIIANWLMSPFWP
ncbi:hypothetical protein L580_3319 [Serratia fonticola AU-P3(3)]|nr:hypothetical protein L580_3319 [Serratia fonticola AU-P3(3)]